MRRRRGKRAATWLTAVWMASLVLPSPLRRDGDPSHWIHLDAAGIRVYTAPPMMRCLRRRSQVHSWLRRFHLARLMNNLVSAVLAIAHSQIGVEEHPRYSNRGPEVDAYLAAVGLTYGPGQAGDPWCGALVNWCITHGISQTKISFDWLGESSRSCQCILNWARDNKIAYDTPQVGDIMLVIGDNGNAEHTGLVTGASDGHFGTIEGNTNNDGGREGYAVMFHTREIGSRYRFVRWADLIPQKSPRLILALPVSNPDAGAAPYTYHAVDGANLSAGQFYVSASVIGPILGNNRLIGRSTLRYYLQQCGRTINEAATAATGNHQNDPVDPRQYVFLNP